ncbi:NAD-dependent epimerase/dehydratase family protein [Paraburkholderia sp. J67]|uniref:NAD-dependent epimerase/dehydratase family protein n=1 Tax=Paraburkholderia sp. J67 TaxID=2805435 RepID=UPI002ABD6780|nr:NAD-dependent epimerase/dehydratase family protein [Paraburkholderia sp. J67]
MRIVLFGATGMVGQGVLRACLKARDVSEIIVVGRRAPPGYDDARIKTVIVADLDRFNAADVIFARVDACFFCIGVTSFRMSEAAYRAVTYDMTLHVAQQLLARSPGMTMVYVSGAGADSSEQGKTMWARIRGQTENALQRMPFGQVAIFRPSAIIPEDGIQSRTTSYRWMYRVLKPLLVLMRRVAPASVLTTGIVGDAMLNAVRHGVPQPVLDPAAIDRLAATPA